MTEYFNTDGSTTSGYTKVQMLSTDGSAVFAGFSGGDVPKLTSTGALTLAASSIPLQTAAGTLKMTITAATANLINAASGTSLDLQYNGTSRVKYDSTGIGFFAATPVAQRAAYTQTYSTADRTVATATAVSVATTSATNSSPYGYTGAAQADAIVTNLNAVIADVLQLRKLVNALIDDSQALGFAT